VPEGNHLYGIVPMSMTFHHGKLSDDISTFLAGRAIAQAVSPRLPTVAARARAQVTSCGIFGGQSGTGASFLRVLRFPPPILILPTAPYSKLSSGAGAIGQLVVDVPSGLRAHTGENLSEGEYPVFP
jgi:hypothetical protein